jgi:hypothetical protein
MVEPTLSVTLALAITTSLQQRWVRQLQTHLLTVNESHLYPNISFLIKAGALSGGAYP